MNVYFVFMIYLFYDQEVPVRSSYSSERNKSHLQILYLNTQISHNIIHFVFQRIIILIKVLHAF